MVSRYNKTWQLVVDTVTLPVAKLHTSDAVSHAQIAT